MSDQGSTYWPLDRLVLRVAELTLRPLRETDLDTVGVVLPPDLEMNPATPQPFGAGERVARAVAMRQEYWRELGSWTPDRWEVGFGVFRGDEMVGGQALEGRDFALLRTVETASWLRVEQRGRGLGKLARVAVLSLAFDGLGAETALSEAWSDNGASLGVSRSLGYQPNGSVRHRRGDVASEMPRLRLDREGWRAVVRPPVEIEGLEACLPWFIAAHAPGR
jgi:RimJ/RimL family protein N-acetyltransferase